MSRARPVPLRLTVIVAAFVLVASGCGSGDNAGEGAVAVESATPSALPTSTPQPTAGEPTPSEVVPPTPTPTPESGCQRLADFEGADPGAGWQVVNDGVMGGRSFGETTFADGAMTFAGTIVTDGGGFSSVRLGLPLGGLGEATELRLRVRTDGRSYEVQADDVAPGRDRQVSHFGPVVVGEPRAWEEVSVVLGEMEARFFGRPVDDAPFEPAQATSIGVFLADGLDGPFMIEVDWIDVCQ